MRYCDERKYKSSKNESNKTIVLNLGQGWCSVLGSAVWSFDRRHPFSKVTTANSESTGNVGVIVEILSLVKKWHPKWNIENFFGFVPLRLWELWILLLASWGGWIIRARPLAGIMIYKTGKSQSPTILHRVCFIFLGSRLISSSHVPSMNWLTASSNFLLSNFLSVV